MKSIFKTLLIIFATFVTFAAADKISPDGYSTWEFFVLGGASTFRDIFIAITNYANTSSFRTLTAFIALLGFLVLMIQNTVQLDPKKLGVYFIAVWVATYATFYSKVDLMIIDSVGANVRDGLHVVTDVPASVGLPAAWTSSIGEYFADEIDTYFVSAHSGLQYSNTRTLNMEGQILKDMMEVHVFDEELTRSLSLFYVDCLFPLVANGMVSMKTLLQSNDIANEFVPYLNPALMTSDETDGGALKTCEDAYTNSYATEMSLQAAAIFTPQYQGEGQAQSSKSVGFTVGAFGPLATAVLSSVDPANPATPTDLVKNRSVARAFDAGLKANSAKLGLDKATMTTFLIEEQAVEQQTQGWRVAMDVFNSMVGYIFVVLHAFIIGVSPLIMVLIFIPGVAGKLILSYLQILFWLTLWQPMMTIVNFIIVSFQENALSTILNGTTQAASSTLAAPDFWVKTTTAIDKYQLAAGFLGTMVPMISWGLVKGGMAFSQFISSGIGTSVAQGAAKNLATGTLSMDNVSFNNTSGNKFDPVHSQKAGMGPNTIYQSLGEPTVRQQHTGGTQYSENGVAKETNATTMKAHAFSQDIKLGEKVQQTQQVAEMEAFKKDVAIMQALSNSVAKMRQRGEDVTSSDTYQQMIKHQQAMKSDYAGENGELIKVNLSRMAKSNASMLAANSIVEKGDDAFFEAYASGDTATVRSKLQEMFAPDTEQGKKLRQTLKDHDVDYQDWENDAVASAAAMKDAKFDATTGETTGVVVGEAVTEGAKGFISAFGNVASNIPIVGAKAKMFTSALNAAVPQVKMEGTHTTGFESQLRIKDGETLSHDVTGAKTMQNSVAKNESFLKQLAERQDATLNESALHGKGITRSEQLAKSLTLSSDYNTTSQSTINSSFSFSDTKRLDALGTNEMREWKNGLDTKYTKLFDDADKISLQQPDETVASEYHSANRPKELQAGSASSSDLSNVTPTTLDKEGLQAELAESEENTTATVESADLKARRTDFIKELDDKFAAFEALDIAGKLNGEEAKIHYESDALIEDMYMEISRSTSLVDAAENSRIIQASEAPGMGNVDKFTALSASDKDQLAADLNMGAYASVLMSNKDNAVAYAPINPDKAITLGDYTHAENKYYMEDGAVKVEAIYNKENEQGQMEQYQINKTSDGNVFYQKVSESDIETDSDGTGSYQAVGESTATGTVYRSTDANDTNYYQKSVDAETNTTSFSVREDVKEGSFAGPQNSLIGTNQPHIKKDGLDYDYQSTKGYYEIPESQQTIREDGNKLVGMDEHQQAIVEDPTSGERFVEVDNKLEKLNVEGDKPYVISESRDGVRRAEAKDLEGRVFSWDDLQVGGTK